MRTVMLFLPLAVFIVTPAVLAMAADISEAIQRCLKHSAAAADMSLSDQRLSEFRNHATTPLDVRRLAVLGEKNPNFFPEWIAIMAARHGLRVIPNDVAHLVDGVEELVRERRRMAKASLTPAADARRVS